MEDQGPGPVAVETIVAEARKLQRAWARIAARAPESVRIRVEAVLAQVEDPAIAEAPLNVRLKLARAIEDLQLELRGQVPFEPQFYQQGRLAIVRVYEPVRIRGAVDHRRVEQFFELYLRRAEEAWARMIYFLKRAGVDISDEDKKVAPWDQPYAALEEYRELIWGRMKPPETAPPPRRG